LTRLFFADRPAAGMTAAGLNHIADDWARPNRVS
jgi:hypothetical protein